MSRTPGAYSVRHAMITKVYRTHVECRYTDREGEHSVRCSMPHPHAGVGSGIFVGIQVGTRVLLSMAPQEQAFIVSVVPERSYFFDQDDLPDSSVDITAYPDTAPGEIYLKGPLNSTVRMMGTGNIAIESNAGAIGADIELSHMSEALYIRTNNVYKFSEAGRHIDGIISRDQNDIEDPNVTSTVNFLSGEAYDYILCDIGRSPEEDISLRSSQISTLTIRNPALVEKRDVTYEFADSFGVRDIVSEASATALIDGTTINSSSQNIVVNPSHRENRRTDTLDLNLRNYNHLIEKTEGTVVDIYGNILDLNRTKIQIPNLENLGAKASKIEQKLNRIYSYLRRSIKYHFEINSRKDVSTPDLSIKNVSYNAKEHSRWSIDVDGEGLTKINIPASSETGNIPVLGRYIVSRDAKDPSSGSFKDPQKIDVRLLPFGAITTSKKIAGAAIVNSEYLPTTVAGGNIDGYAAVGTAHHNILTIAPSIFSTGELQVPNLYPYKKPYPSSPSVGPVVTKIDNSISPIQSNGSYQTNPKANAGGRSIHANLDGSAEISIGADTADRKSLVIDLAGGVISHYGRDINGRSVIHQTDGDVLIQIGGKGLTGDTRFTSLDSSADRPGRIEIHLNNPGKTSHKIIIDENGMTISINGNVALVSSGDFTISAGGNLLLNGCSVKTYGSVDTSNAGNRKIAGAESRIDRTGRNISG